MQSTQMNIEAAKSMFGNSLDQLSCTDQIMSTQMNIDVQESQESQESIIKQINALWIDNDNDDSSDTLEDSSSAEESSENSAKSVINHSKSAPTESIQTIDLDAVMPAEEVSEDEEISDVSES